ncbi:hypothetical protein HHI36_010662 [Cryptolaemus montrouzieri]|uniref:Uncharacterized protein n=1 Tax=Cryptolaemus montrouzieri TaxID=559131 RepID=A0ABD2MJI6_9CUCU
MTVLQIQIIEPGMRRSKSENEDDEVNIDEIIRSSEDSKPDPSPSTSAVLTGSLPTQSDGRPRKPQKLNLRCKKKYLLLNEQQLRSLENENILKDILDLDSSDLNFLDFVSQRFV